MTQEQLDKVLEKHQLWLLDEPGGERAELGGKDLRCLDFHNTNLTGAFLNDADMSYTDCSHAVLNDCTMSGARLVGANLAGAKLDKAWAGSADFSGSDCQEASFAEAGLQNAYFASTDLTNANFQNAGCTFADFSRARVEGADFRGAKLDGITTSAGNRGIGQLEVKSPNISQKPVPSPSADGIPLAELDLSVRTYNSMRKQGIVTVEQFAQLTDADLDRLKPIIGWKIIPEIVEKRQEALSMLTPNEPDEEQTEDEDEYDMEM